MPFGILGIAWFELYRFGIEQEQHASVRFCTMQTEQEATRLNRFAFAYQLPSNLEFADRAMNQNVIHAEFSLHTYVLML